MDKIITYRVLPELKLVLEMFSGPVTFHDYINLKEKFRKDSAFNPAYNFIIDIRKSTILADKSDIEKFVDYYRAHQELVSKRMCAILTDTPDQVVFSTLFKNSASAFQMQYEVVSTLQSAMKWVNIPSEHYLTIDNVITEMGESTNPSSE